MLLTNFYNIIALTSFGYRYKPAQLAVKTANGGTQLGGLDLYYAGKTSFSILPSKIITNINNANSGDSCLLFSDDTSDVNINDFTTSSISTISGSLGASTTTYDNETKTYTITQRYAVSNTSSNSITINSYAFVSGLQLSGTWTSMMTFREKLNEPFVLSGGETVNFDLTAVYNMPINYIPN